MHFHTNHQWRRYVNQCWRSDHRKICLSWKLKNQCRVINFKPTYLIMPKSIPVLQPLRRCYVDRVIHHERYVREEQKYICVARASNNKRDCEHDLYCCLLPRCEALRTCRSGFPIATPASSLTENTPIPHLYIDVVKLHQQQWSNSRKN